MSGAYCENCRSDATTRRIYVANLGYYVAERCECGQVHERLTEIQRWHRPKNGLPVRKLVTFGPTGPGRQEKARRRRQLEARR